MLETGGPVLTPWRNQVRGLVEAWYPGEQGGPAIARALFGDTDPAGRLPVTFPRQEGDIPTAGDPQKYPGVAEEESYKEGVLVGYRWYDHNGLTPAFPFGFGRSYTTFVHRGLRIRRAPGGASVSVEAVNTGRRAGVDVAELYLGLPQPRPGVVQPPRAFSYWDVGAHAWRVAPACYRVMVGRSSRQIDQRATVAVNGAHCRRAAAALSLGSG